MANWWPICRKLPRKMRHIAHQFAASCPPICRILHPKHPLPALHIAFLWVRKPLSARYNTKKHQPPFVKNIQKNDNIFFEHEYTWIYMNKHEYFLNTNIFYEHELPWIAHELLINYSLQFTLTGKHPDPQQRIRSNEWWVSGEVSDEVIMKHLTIGKADKQGDSPCFGEVLPHF